MTFWAPVLHSTSLGDELRNLAPAFVGRHVVPRYRGYMQSQALRLLGQRGGGHGRRGGGQREELIAEHGYDTKYAMHAARLGFQCIELLSTSRLAQRIEQLAEDESVPAGPDRARIEAWSADGHLRHWRAHDRHT
jgi:uncharacterized protein